MWIFYHFEKCFAARKTNATTSTFACSSTMISKFVGWFEFDTMDWVWWNLLALSHSLSLSLFHLSGQGATNELAPLFLAAGVVIALQKWSNITQKLQIFEKADFCQLITWIFHKSNRFTVHLNPGFSLIKQSKIFINKKRSILKKKRKIFLYIKISTAK